MAVQSGNERIEILENGKFVSAALNPVQYVLASWIGANLETTVLCRRTRTDRIMRDSANSNASAQSMLLALS